MDNQLRCFIAIRPPEELLDKILDIRKEFEKKLPGNFIRWCSKEQLHLTLKFLGNVKDEDIEKLKDSLRDSCTGFSRFELAICGLGCFPNFDFPRVIWLGITGDTGVLISLQETIEINVCEFGECKEEQEFRPHLTLGRIKNAPRKELVSIAKELKIAAEKIGLIGSWIADEVLLMQSILQQSGAVYKELAKFKLQQKSC
ncbi:MAG: RNA 2',3'-cyclic phosphodiesterase [Verrucomicrobiia bacterium]